MKRAAVILLSLFFVYGGVARALTTCLRDHEHSDHSEAHHFHSHDSSRSQNSEDPAGPTIHCPFPENLIGPATSSGLSTLRRPHERMLVDARLFDIAGSATAKDNLWLEAVFRRIVAPGNSSDRGRHLFLSVLRI
jgi:hypothetical protein